MYVHICIWVDEDSTCAALGIRVCDWLRAYMNVASSYLPGYQKTFVLRNQKDNK